ncbi:MAG: hypothetical protein C0412_20110 [Flavobacterium sp.]|nr:hypothetical protein [Flavobacterium sp.]
MVQRWLIQKTIYKVSDFISFQRQGSLILNPNFQRRQVWQPGAKSYLIDTIVKGLPMPLIFLREKKTNLKELISIREVVDGQQRLRTIFSYIDPSLLKDFNPERDVVKIKANHDKRIAGKKFSELDQNTKQDILDYEFSVHILPLNTDDRDVLQIFSRMNSTGVKLNPQELRNAEYFGSFKTTMYSLASEQLERWIRWKIFTLNQIARMQEVELVSEFAILMLKGLQTRSKPLIDKIYRYFEQRDPIFPEKKEITTRFRKVMDTVEYYLDERIVNTIFQKKDLFYILFAVLYDLYFGLNSHLKKTKIEPVTKDVIEKIESLGLEIQKKSAPLKVMSTIEKRYTNLNSRNILFKYFQKGITRK